MTTTVKKQKKSATIKAGAKAFRFEVDNSKESMKVSILNHCVTHLLAILRVRPMTSGGRLLVSQCATACWIAL